MKGFVRRFWNKSADHRGTEDFFGLVVCLVDVRADSYPSDTQCKVDGIVYEVHEDSIAEVLDILDVREKYGYERRVARACDELLSVELGDCFVYCACIGDDTIDVFLGPFQGIHNTQHELKMIARRIMKANGPSGRNVDYLFHLHDALNRLGFGDDHVDALVRICVNLEPNSLDKVYISW